MYFEHDYVKYPELTNAQLGLLGFSSPHEQITEDFDAEVVKVHDGDTITVRCSFRDFDFPVRLLNIDAPELSEGGGSVRDYLKDRVLGQTVKIVINRNNRVGQYGRLLGQLFYQGLDIGQEMINQGLVFLFGLKMEGQVPSLYKTFDLRTWF